MDAWCGSCAGLGGKKAATTEEVFWDTAKIQSVTKITEDGLPKGWAKVSPDGTKMLYCESSRNVSGLPYWNIMLLRDVRVPAKTPLVTDFSYSPAWYDDNNRFLYVSYENNSSRIVRSAAAGMGKTYVTRNPVGKNDNSPTVRNAVILCHTENGIDENGAPKYQIVSMKDNGTEVTMLGDGHSPAWHPTEPKFVFIRKGDVCEMDMESLQTTQLFSDPTYTCALPSYSGDGKYILFQKGAEEKVVGNILTKVGGLFKRKKTVAKTTTKWQIFIMRTDGTNISPVTMGSVNCFSPSWDASNYLYFIADAGGKSELYRARVNLEE